MSESVNPRIDIIIPVYNALDDLKLCIESLKKYVDFSKDRVIIVNDCSPDENVMPYLRTIESEDFVVLENEHNMGFSASVNAGMSYSSSDVLLLNSDTIVTEHFADKIYRCAYSEEYIATVTPFSNSATICSLPEVCRDNALDHDKIDLSAEIVEKLSRHKYPRIPVAIGFCMFIKRSVISKVGLFNAEVFQRGYGEENDFCYRCEQYGYKHVICDDAFVYHKGTASFSNAQKAKLCEEHSRWLRKNYPNQESQITQYVSYDVNKDFRDAYKIMTAISENGRKNILYLLHLDFRDGAPAPYGGVQMHVKDLKNNLIKNNNVFVLVREGSSFILTIYTDRKTFTLKYKVYNNVSNQVFYDKEYYDLFRNILSTFRIDIVHVHHIINLSYDIYKAAKALKIPVITTLHDYYFICPALWMMDLDNKLCFDSADREKCSACLFKRSKVSKFVDIESDWRKNAFDALNMSDVIISPSEYTKNIYLDYFPSLAEKENFIVVEHGSSFGDSLDVSKIKDKCVCYIDTPFAGTNTNRISGWAYLPGSDSLFNKVYVCIKDSNGFEKAFSAMPSKRKDVMSAHNNSDALYTGFEANIPLDIFAEGMMTIRIAVFNSSGACGVSDPVYYSYLKPKKIVNADFNTAFIGGIAEHKGSRTICSLIKSQLTDRSVKWHLFGNVGDKEIADMPDSILVKTGSYDRNELPTLVNKYDIKLICIFSIFPESFCYTLSEALMCGIPVVVRDIGALGDRVREMDCGWIVPLYASDKEIADVINRIVNDSTEYNSKLENVKKLTVKSCEKMAAEYDEIMNELPVSNMTFSFDKELIYEGIEVNKNSSFVPSEYMDALNNSRAEHIVRCQQLDDECSALRQQNENLQNELRNRDAQLEDIFNSNSWKLIRKLNGKKVPFKGLAKKVFLRSK